MKTNDENQQPDPFSPDLEQEAIRRGRALVNGRTFGKGTPVVLIWKEWERFESAEKSRADILYRWKQAQDRLHAARETLKDAALDLHRAALRAETETSFAGSGTTAALIAALIPAAQAIRLEEVARFLRKTPEHAKVAAYLESTAAKYTEWRVTVKTRQESFNAIHGELTAIRREWAEAWDGLAEAARKREEEYGLYRRLFQRSQHDLNREGIPALMPVLTVRAQLREAWQQLPQLKEDCRELVRWAKQGMLRRPVAMAVVAAMAAATLTAGGAVALAVKAGVLGKGAVVAAGGVGVRRN